MKASFLETESYRAEDFCVIFCFMQLFFNPYSSASYGYLKKSHSDIQAKNPHALWTAVATYSSALLALPGLCQIVKHRVWATGTVRPELDGISFLVPAGPHSSFVRVVMQNSSTVAHMKAQGSIQECIYSYMHIPLCCSCPRIMRAERKLPLKYADGLIRQWQHSKDLIFSSRRKGLEDSQIGKLM